MGVVCGCAMVGSVAFVDKVLRIDDPVGAVSVHGLCGILGTVMTGLFATDGGLFYGGGWKFLGIETRRSAGYGASELNRVSKRRALISMSTGSRRITHSLLTAKTPLLPPAS